MPGAKQRRRTLAKRSALAAVGMALMSWGVAHAAPPGVQVVDAWSRPTPKGLTTGVVYLTLVNHAAKPDRLVSASTPVAQRMELHRSSVSAGVMSMQAIPNGVDIPANGRLVLAPGGYHFMLMGMKTGLAPGARFSATLRLAHDKPLAVEVSVRTAAPQPAMKGMEMGER